MPLKQSDDEVRRFVDGVGGQRDEDEDEEQDKEKHL